MGIYFFNQFVQYKFELLIPLKSTQYMTKTKKQKMNLELNNSQINFFFKFLIKIVLSVSKRQH